MKRIARLSLVLGCAAALSGCVSLLPKGKPAHLYRFGQPSMTSEAPPALSPPATSRVGVLRAAGSFQQESAGDRLLTITGEKAAYIAETRWVAPAAVLFDQALARAFEEAGGPVRLVSRGEPSRTSHALRIDIRNFETRYDNGPDSTPSVLIRVRCVLTRNDDREHPAEQILEARASAGTNRVTSIVPAYDKAVGDVMKQLVAWTQAQTAANAPAATPAPRAASPR